MRTDRCYISEIWTSRDTCGPDTAVGEACYGDGSCGTDSDANTCLLAPFGVTATYTRVDCTWAPPSPPPPSLPPRPPAGPGESAYLPAPPPPSTQLQAQAAKSESEGFLGLSLGWLIVLATWAVALPTLLCLFCCYFRHKLACFWPAYAPDDTRAGAGLAAPEEGVHYGGTLVLDDSKEETEVARKVSRLQIRSAPPKPSSSNGSSFNADI